MNRNPFYDGMIDEKYREFSEGIVKDPALPVLGIRLPQLRKLAKQFTDADFPILTHEDVLLKGLIISGIRKPFAERKLMLNELLPHLTAWDHSDITGQSMKIRKGEEDEAFSYFSSLLHSPHAFIRRLGIVFLFSHRRLYPKKGILQLIADADSDEYYVSMAVAWAIQVFWKDAPFALSCLPEVSCATRKRAEQKIRDSLKRH